MSNHKYAIIMAGGSGTRLFPRSRENAPKQFQKVIGSQSLFLQTYKRVARVVPANHIYISTNKKYVNLINKELPSFPIERILVEPEKRNTAPAMALATALIAKHDPRAEIFTSASDHLIINENAYSQAIKSAFGVISKYQNHIVTIGIHPTHPHTGYGYIERGKLILDDGNFTTYIVKRFVEKPDLKTAKRYLTTSRFFWNASYFLWRADHFMNELKTLAPTIHQGVVKICDAGGKNQFENVLKKEFLGFPNIPIDTAIMEKTKNLLVLHADLGWSDVGSWDSVIDLIDKSKRDNYGNYAEGLYIGVDTYNSNVLSENPKQLVATIGVENLTVVTTGDAVLIAAKGRSEEVKKVIEEIKNRKLGHLL